MKKPTLTAVGGTGVPASQAGEETYRALALDVLARTIWGEARGEGAEGMQAVACVVLNREAVARARGGYWWGGDVIRICQKPYQFSCWNRADPNFQKLMSVTPERDLYFATALRIAHRALAGVLPDNTGGATHYHAYGILPRWAEEAEPVTTIGHHVFYRL